VGTKINRYRSLYLLNHLHNECYSPHHLPAFLIFMGFLALIGGCGTIRLYDCVNIGEYIFILELATICNLFGYLILYVSSYVYKSSSETLAHIVGSGCRGKVLRRTFRSLRPFGVRIEPIKAVKFNAVTAYFLNLSNATTSVLVSFSK